MEGQNQAVANAAQNLAQNSNQFDAASAAAAEGAVESVSFMAKVFGFMDDGGAFMWVILLCWLFGLAVAVERFIKYYSFDIDGAGLMREIRRHVLENNVHAAINLCSESKAILPQVLKNALKRSNQNKEVIQDAVDATALEVVPQVEKRLGYLALIANVSTLIGLLGTIQGLIASFAAVAGADPSEKAKLLAEGIATAMNTTAFGLISAITIMVIHSILSHKSEKILGEMDEYAFKLVDLLGTKKEIKRVS